jgi:putative CocE/NonD family hydrolase
MVGRHGARRWGGVRYRRVGRAGGSAVLVALAALVVPTGAVVAVPTAAAASPPTECSYVTDNCDATTSSVERTNVPITMSDGTILESDEYVPTTCTAVHRCPVILIQTPYRKGDSASPQDLESVFAPEVAPIFFEHGYIEVVVDVRGTGSSEGYWDSLGPREQQDGAELVQWVANPANLPESDGVVGLAGASYAAINQLLTVEAINRDIAGHGPLTDPGSGCTTTASFDCGNPTHIRTDPVKAIFPIAAAADVYRDLIFAGGNIDSSFLPIWLPPVQASSLEPPDETTSDPPVALNALSQHVEDLFLFGGVTVADGALGSDESLLPEELQTYPQVAYDTSFYTERSPITDIDEVDVPTFVVGGTYDLFQRGEPINYNALALPPNEKKLLIGPWYHGTVGTGLPATDVAGTTIPALGNLELAWFDHWLRGTDNGVQDFPQVETYDLGADRWVPSSSYPAPGATGQRWYLGAGGSLSTTRPTALGHEDLPTVTATGTCSRSTFQWTEGLLSALPVCQNDSNLAEAQGLTFTTAPFTAPYTLSGPIEADIFMSSTATDSTVIATVSDVSPSGPGGTTIADDITAGTLVASMRPVTATPCTSQRDRANGATFEVVRNCSLYLDGQSIEPWHPYTEASQRLLQPGRITELRIEIFPTSQTFEPGQRMRVTITTSDVPHELQTLSTTTHSVGLDAFYTGGNAASSIYVGTTTPIGRPGQHR